MHLISGNCIFNSKRETGRRAMRRTSLVLLVLCARAQYAHGQFEYFVPQVIAGENAPQDRAHCFQTQFHIINLSSDQVSVEIRATRDEGAPMAVLAQPGLVRFQSGSSSVTFVIPVRGQRTISTLNGPFRQIGWAVIRSTGRLGVVVTLQYLVSGSGQVVTSTSLLPDPPQRKFSMWVAMGTDIASGVAVLNPSALESAQVNFRLFDRSGQFAGERTIVLPPSSKIAQFLNENQLYTELRDFQGTVEVSSAVPVAVTTIRVEKTYWSTFPAFPPRPVTAQSSAPTLKYFVPQVVDGRDPVESNPRFHYRTAFHAVNLTDVFLNVTVQTKDSEGKPLKIFNKGGTIGGPRWEDRDGFYVHPLGRDAARTGVTASRQVGWAEISTSGPAGIVVTLRGEEAVGSLLTTTSLIPEEPTTSFSAYALVSPSASTGIALLNPWADSSGVILRLSDRDGSLVGERGFLLLGGRKMAQFLNEKDLFPNLENFEGTLQVASTRPLAATVIRVDGIYWSTFRVFPLGQE